MATIQFQLRYQDRQAVQNAELILSCKLKNGESWQSHRLVSDDAGLASLVLDLKLLRRFDWSTAKPRLTRLKQPLTVIGTDGPNRVGRGILEFTVTVKKEDLLMQDDESPVLPSGPLPPEAPDDQWRVMGRVTRANGEPVSAVVSVDNVKLDKKFPLGRVQTDKGVYVIAYQPEIMDSPLSGCKLPDLLIQAYQNDQLIASSEIIYNAKKVTTVDLVVGNETYKGPSEYQRLEQSLKPCLGDHDPATLNGENVEYLANKTGANLEWVQLYVIAHRQGRLIEAAPPLFYGCYRKQLPYSLDKLIALRPQVIKSRLKMAIEDNIIDDKWQTGVDEFIALLQNASIQSSLTIDETSNKNSLGKVLTQINIPAQPQAALLNLYIKHQENPPAFWRALAKHKTLGQFEEQLRLVLKVSALTQHYEPATKAIMDHSVFAQSADVFQLARLGSSDWTQLARSIGSVPENIPGQGEEQLENYGRLMEKTIMSAFPTEHVAANVVQSDKYKDTELPKFFQIAPDFSFEGTNIPAYVNKMKYHRQGNGDSGSFKITASVLSGAGS